MEDATNTAELTKVIQDETKTMQDDIKNYNIKSAFLYSKVLN